MCREVEDPRAPQDEEPKPVRPPKQSPAPPPKQLPSSPTQGKNSTVKAPKKAKKQYLPPDDNPEPSQDYEGSHENEDIPLDKVNVDETDSFFDESQSQY